MRRLSGNSIPVGPDLGAAAGLCHPLRRGCGIRPRRPVPLLARDSNDCTLATVANNPRERIKPDRHCVFCRIGGGSELAEILPRTDHQADERDIEHRFDLVPDSVGERGAPTSPCVSERSSVVRSVFLAKNYGAGELWSNPARG